MSIGTMIARGARLQLEYVNSQGDHTTRAVSFEQFGQTGTGVVYLIGFCHLREEIRHFRVDRIQSILYPDGRHVQRNVIEDMIMEHGRDATHLPRIMPDNAPIKSMIRIDENDLQHLESKRDLPQLPTEMQLRAIAKLGIDINFGLSYRQAHALLSARNFAQFALDTVGLAPSEPVWHQARATLIAFIISDHSRVERIEKWSNRRFGQRAEGKSRPKHDVYVKQILDRAKTIREEVYDIPASGRPQSRRSAPRVQANRPATNSNYELVISKGSKGHLLMLIALIIVITTIFVYVR